jgi:hypothetical protein
MKKNNLRLLTILILLLILSIVLFLKNYEFSKKGKDGNVKWKIERKTSSLKALRDFSVSDTAAINKIFLVDKDNNQILLTRENNEWIVNKHYSARKDLINILLETIKRVEVQSPVQQSMHDYVIRDLASNCIKCEIYQDNKLVKTYYVGGVTPDNLGTYMLIENSSEPFITSLPAFSGFLTTRYNTSLKEWRSKLVYAYPINDIRTVTVDFPEHPEDGYEIKTDGNNHFELYQLSTKLPVNNFDTIQVKQHLSRFKKVGFEFFVPDVEKQEKMDSIKQFKPFVRFTVSTFSGKYRTLNCYRRPNIDQLKDDEGNSFDMDIERLYGIFDEELVVMQYYTLDPLTRKISEFMK